MLTDDQPPLGFSILWWIELVLRALARSSRRACLRVSFDHLYGSWTFVAPPFCDLLS